MSDGTDPRQYRDMAQPPSPTGNAQQVATRIGVTERTVRRWIESGRLPAAKHGREFAIRLEDADRLRPTSGSEVVDLLAALRDAEVEIAEWRARCDELRRCLRGTATPEPTAPYEIVLSEDHQIAVEAKRPPDMRGFRGVSVAPMNIKPVSGTPKPGGPTATSEPDA